MRQRIFFVIATVAAALTCTTAALAGNVTATATVSGAGALSFSHGATASVSSTLDGTDQTVSYSLPLSIADVRGSGAGWNLTITSTTFTDASSHTLSTSASSIASASSACTAGGSCTSPTNAIGFPLTVPAAASAPAAVKLFNAAANSGMGRFTVTPVIDVLVPGNAYAGAYTSTVTVAAVSGP
jgi:hypothetical protein